MEYEDYFYEVRSNQYGFPQTYQIGLGHEFPVCICCHAMVMPNRGQGTACDTCNHEALMHAEHDYCENQ